MKSIAFVIPWGGNLPVYFQLWLESCRRNPSVDFLVFTDDCTEYNYPDNVKVHYMSFEQMKELFQKHYDFPLSISAPYKFCDFRPAFGEIFSDYLVGYDYWGHCDVDLIWGDIRKFVTDDVLTKYKRIFQEDIAAFTKIHRKLMLSTEHFRCVAAKIGKMYFKVKSLVVLMNGLVIVGAGCRKS